MNACRWHSLDTINLLVCELGLILLATLSRASCTAIIVASGVNGIVIVFQPGEASSLYAHSMIGTRLLPLSSVSLHLSYLKISTFHLDCPSESMLRLDHRLYFQHCQIGQLGHHIYFRMTWHTPIQVSQSFSVMCPTSLCGHVFTIPGYDDYPDLKVPMDAWLTFLVYG